MALADSTDLLVAAMDIRYQGNQTATLIDSAAAGDNFTAMKSLNEDIKISPTKLCPARSTCQAGRKHRHHGKCKLTFSPRLSSA